MSSDASGAPSPHRCAIVGEAQLEKLMLRYLGLAPELTHDETEILLFALYMESLQVSSGLAAKCTAILDGRLKAQVDRLAGPVRCSDCGVGVGGQHKPGCHRQGLVTSASDYRDRAVAKTGLPGNAAALRDEAGR